MAEVPREAVEFARVCVRAFYPPEYVVALDGILRGNNYCAHHNLANRLQQPAKELRITLNKMVHARLVTCEKRTQRRINFRDDRRPSRAVSTEFWFVPLRELVDGFTYRVHKVTKELETVIATHAQQRSYVCERCGSVYSELDIAPLLAEDGSGFVCDRFGMVVGRRQGECGGRIVEQSNADQLKEAEALKRKFEAQLQTLRERAQKCLTLEIPAHPLQDADAETWGEIVPENIGIHGETVDEHGYTADIAAEVKGLKTIEAEKKVEKPVMQEEKKEDVAIPDKPSWFKDSAGGDEDADDDWDDDAAQQNVLKKNTTGTAATFRDESDAKSYYEHFLRQAGGVVDEAAPEGAVLEAAAPENEVKDMEVDAAPAEAEKAEPEVMVKVAGKDVPMSQVTEEMKEEMTAEEYEAYFALAKNDDDDDDDDEFE